MRGLLSSSVLLLVFIAVFSNNPAISPRIAGGRDADEVSAPFQCSFQKNHNHLCGCVIISAEWVITAGQCPRSVDAEDSEILVGTNQWRFGGKRHKVNMTIVHEWYGWPTKHSNDIALIRVNEPFEFNEKCQPIKYSTEEVPVHTKLQFTGWGKLSMDEGNGNDNRPDNLQVLNLISITNDECKFLSNVAIDDTELCTVNPPGKGMCLGDSGGALVFKNQLVGIALWAVPYTGDGKPISGFTRVSFHFKWIEDILKMSSRN